jgi:hypothetical protein
MAYVTNPARRSPIAFGVRRRGYSGPVHGNGLSGPADAGVPSSATPNPPNLTSGPSPQLVQSPASSYPLDYVSPQSAIAAGLDPTKVNTAWTAYVNSFPGVQAAINAGLAPGVVTEYWNGGPGPAPPLPWYKKYAVLLLAGGGAVLLALAGKEEPR